MDPAAVIESSNHPNSQNLLLASHASNLKFVIKANYDHFEFLIFRALARHEQERSRATKGSKTRNSLSTVRSETNCDIAQQEFFTV